MIPDEFQISDQEQWTFLDRNYSFAAAGLRVQIQAREIDMRLEIASFAVIPFQIIDDTLRVGINVQFQIRQIHCAVQLDGFDF